VADASSDPALLCVVKEYGLSHADLARVLPRLGTCRWDATGSYYELDWEGRVVSIGVGPEQQRRLGMMRLPFVSLEFRFRGWPPASVPTFLARFDRSFQKGGG
jgi:hypothetical protein